MNLRANTDNSIPVAASMKSWSYVSTIKYDTAEKLL